MTAPTARRTRPSGRAGSAHRPVRRALDDLGLSSTRARRAVAADDPDWLAADRRAAFERYDGAAGRVEPALHAVHRPARRRARRRRARDRRSGARRRPSDAARRAPTASPSSSRAASTRSSCPTAAPSGRRRHARRLVARRPRRGRPTLLADGDALPADDKFAQLTRALLDPGRRRRRARRRPARRARSSSAGRLGEAGSGAADPDARPPRRGRRRVGRRGARAVRSRDGASRAAGALRRHARRSCSGRRPSSRVASLQELPRTSSRSSTATAEIGEGADAPLGARPARRPARPQPRRQPPRGRPQLGRAGRDRVRRRRPALRPDLVHDATSGATRPATCCRRARCSTGRAAT